MRPHKSFFRGIGSLAVHLAAVVAFMGANAACASAQGAHFTADRQETISAFGAVSRVYTDYNSKVTGFTIGADITRTYRFLAPSVEFRYTRSIGTPAGEDSLLGGLKLAKRFRRFQPYFEALLGYGMINFPHNPVYPRDNSTVYDGGFGIDYELSRMFSVKVDLHQQFWNLGTEHSELEPVTANIGIVYTVPFGWGRGRDSHR